MTDPTLNTSPDQPTDAAALVEGVMELFPGADRQALNCLASLMDKQAADTTERLQARLAGVEGEAATNLRLANEAADVMNRAIAERDTARQQLVEARAAGMRDCEAICNDEAQQWSDGHMTESKAFAGSAVRVMRRRIREAIAALTPTGADAAQVGGRKDG